MATRAMATRPTEIREMETREMETHNSGIVTIRSFPIATPTTTGRISPMARTTETPTIQMDVTTIPIGSAIPIRHARIPMVQTQTIETLATETLLAKTIPTETQTIQIAIIHVTQQTVKKVVSRKA
jgi:hypothetical protein